MLSFLVCQLFLLATPLNAAHRPLVPRPQQIQYGNGRLALNGREQNSEYWQQINRQRRLRYINLLVVVREKITAPLIFGGLLVFAATFLVTVYEERKRMRIAAL